MVGNERNGEERGGEGKRKKGVMELGWVGVPWPPQLNQHTTQVTVRMFLTEGGLR